MSLRPTQLITLTIIIALVTLYFLLDIDRRFNFETVLQILASLKNSFASQPYIFIAIFFLLYTIATASSLPIAAALTFIGGALMGSTVAPLVIIPAATLGCIVPYLVSKLLLKDYVQLRFKRALIQVNKGVKDSGWWFLLSARLNPILPFVVLNLVSGLANIPLRQYVTATFLGIIPGVVVDAYAGSQIDASVEKGSILQPGVYIALLLLAMVPLVIRYLQKKLFTTKDVAHV